MSKILDFFIPYKTYLLGVLFVFLAISNIGWYLTANNLKVEKELLKTNKITYELAQKDYELKAYKKFKERETEYAEQAKQAKEKYADLRAEYGRNLMRFQAAQSQVRRLAADAKDRSAELSGGTSKDSEILITTNDGLICAENTAKLKAAQEWALKLKEVK